MFDLTKTMLFTTAALCCASPAPAQKALPSPPANPGAERLTDSPALPYLMADEKLSAAEARDILMLQSDIQSLLASNSLTGRDDFVDLVVRNKPYQIILTFERDVEVNEVIALVPQRLRRYVKVRKAKHVKLSRTESIRSLTAALRSANSRFAVGYDADRELFFVDTADAATTASLQRLVPANLTSEVIFLSGALPQPTSNPNAKPTGVVPGDGVWAGWSAYTVGSNAACTLGFAITFATGLEGILTASHCTEPKFIPVETHSYTFPDTYYESPTTGNYDYAIYRTDGLRSDYQLFYNNKRSTAGYGTSGWLLVKNFIRLANQWVGMYTCTSGHTSGLTCAKVLSKTYDWNRTGSSVWVRLSSSTSITEGGDSGGPAFVTLDNSRPSEVTAVGIVAGGGGPYENVGYTSVIMPIDRVFDHVPNVKLKTAP